MVHPNVRGGRKIRKLLNKAKESKKTVYKCPVCKKRSVVNVSFSVWECRSCGATFAGGAYTFTTAPGEEIRRKTSLAVQNKG
ncbi:50S ribosomal protein L37ae [Candidatus Micrarchaeota archaeon]|nr:50S ribosomal protein L37ae [Candidatus Micrarchaeota archaeon]